MIEPLNIFTQQSQKRVLYHGSDRIVEKPLFGFGRSDNDYGSGFYTTEIEEKADEWAIVNGSKSSAYRNCYEIDFNGLHVVNLDEYGPLAWIAEIIANRGARSERSQELGNMIVSGYRVELGDADIIIGYRADDSYIDIIDSFLKNEVSINEVDRLFHKGNLGQQVFIKSQKAFDNLVFTGAVRLDEKDVDRQNEINARMEVSRFLKNRTTAILIDGFVPYGLLARDVIKNHFVYNIDTANYEISAQECEDV